METDHFDSINISNFNNFIFTYEEVFQKLLFLLNNLLTFLLGSFNIKIKLLLPKRGKLEMLFQPDNSITCQEVKVHKFYSFVFVFA